MSRARVAVLGTGIAGMAAAYFLKDECEVVLYEKDVRPGGHTHTVRVEEAGQPVDIDTGFMVFNETTYPNLVKFFKRLEVPSMNAPMSFSVQHLASGLEFCGTGVSGLFAQKRNLFRPSYWRFLLAVDRFNRQSVEVLDEARYAGLTLAEYVKEKRLGDALLEKYILPMSSAIWSTEPSMMNNFPVQTLVRFFKNHGLLGLTTHYQWKTIPGGSRVYRYKVLAFFPDSLRLGQQAVSVARKEGAVFVKDASGRQERYDRAVLAGHADESLAALASPEARERELLGCFSYQRNRAALHTDAAVMPKRRPAWSSWNYRAEKDGSSSVIYWMNSLQQVSKRENYFVSINDPGRIRPKSVLWQGEYTHPTFDLKTVKAQKHLPELNRKGPVYFCGSYFRYGFHEDAFCAGMEAAAALLGRKLSL